MKTKHVRQLSNTTAYGDMITAEKQATFKALTFMVDSLTMAHRGRQENDNYVQLLSFHIWWQIHRELNTLNEHRVIEALKFDETGVVRGGRTGDEQTKDTSISHSGSPYMTGDLYFIAGSLSWGERSNSTRDQGFYCATRHRPPIPHPPPPPPPLFCTAPSLHSPHSPPPPLYCMAPFPLYPPPPPGDE